MSEWEPSSNPDDFDRLQRAYIGNPYSSSLRGTRDSRVDYQQLRRTQDRVFATQMCHTARELVARGRLDAAVEEFSRALGLHHSVEALLGRAAALLAMSNHDGCTRDYNTVLELDPENKEALRYFGSLSQRNATYVRSLKRLERHDSRSDDYNSSSKDCQRDPKKNKKLKEKKRDRHEKKAKKKESRVEV
jgi:tetratricopeptide (TPR) repeat protein